MSFSDNVPKLQPFKRSVSIIGVGATPFVRVMDDPECDGLTEGELFGYAARAAMKDAGITGKDVDFFVHGQAGPGWISNFGTANIHVANWLGMKGKASMHQSEASFPSSTLLYSIITVILSVLQIRFLIRYDQFPFWIIDSL